MSLLTAYLKYNIQTDQERNREEQYDDPAYKEKLRLLQEKEGIKEDKYNFTKLEKKECSNGRYMSVDVETGSTGTVCDIIQLSYIIYDRNDKEVKRVDYYIKDRLVDNFLYGIHKISSEHLKEHGEDFKKVFYEFTKDLANCEAVLGHNVISDIKHIKSNMCKYKALLNYDLFEGKDVIDTMKIGKRLYNLKKNPNLTELVKLSLNEEMMNAHNSLYDCEYTARCYQKMLS